MAYRQASCGRVRASWSCRGIGLIEPGRLDRRPHALVVFLQVLAVERGRFSIRGAVNSDAATYNFSKATRSVCTGELTCSGSGRAGDSGCLSEWRQRRRWATSGSAGCRDRARRWRTRSDGTSSCCIRWKHVSTHLLVQPRSSLATKATRPPTGKVLGVGTPSRQEGDAHINLTVGGRFGYVSSKVSASLNVPSSKGVSAWISARTGGVSTPTSSSQLSSTAVYM